MHEQQPVPLNPTELGVVRSDLPSVLRDSRGRVLWKLPGNTPEQNEQLGIRNIQGLFLEKFPEFNELFPKNNDGKIDEAKRDEAREFILSRVGKKDSAKRVFSQSPRVKRRTPCFNGSFWIALQKSFAPWGIDFKIELNPQAIKEKQLITINKFANKHGITHAHTSKLSEGLPFEIRRLNGRQPYKLYSEEELTQRLDTYIKLPHVNRNTKRYIGENGEAWVGPGIIAKEYLISYGTCLTLLKDVSRIEAINYKGRKTVLYKESDAKRTIEQAVSRRPDLSQFKGESRYIDTNGKAWITIEGLCIKYPGVTYRTILELLKDSPSVKGIVGSENQILFYGETQTIEKISKFLALPQIDKKTKKYTSPDGKNYVGAGLLQAAFKLSSNNSVVLLVKNVPYIEARNTRGVLCHLYSEEEAFDAIRQFYALPQVDSLTGRYVDGEKKWVVVSVIKEELGINKSDSLQSVLNNVPFILGRDRTGKRVKIYDESILIKILAENGYRDYVEKPNISSEEAMRELEKMLE